MSNQHMTQAVSRLRNGTINEVARAGVEATLALAFEQRTANLIALYNMTESNCEGLSTAGPMSRDNWDSIARQIKERTDLS